MERTILALELKAADDATRVLEGIATTPTADRGDDIIEPSGAQFTLPIPLLWQHDTTQPIGEVFEARVSPTGIAIKARIATVDEPGALKTRLDEAYQTMKAGLVRGLSVGIKPIEWKPITGSLFGRHILKWFWGELSAVTIPANLDARIMRVKADAPTRITAMQTQTTAERITALENSRAAKVAQLTGIQTKAHDAGLTIAGGPDAEEYDAVELEVKNIDSDLARLRTLEQINRSAATPVPATPAAAARPYSQVVVKSNLPPGTAFVRAACAVVLHKGNWSQAIEYADQRWGRDTPEVALYLKAAVAAGNTTDATWAGPLVNQNISSEFIDLLRPATILGKVPNLRQVPFNTKVPSQTAGGAYGWVGEAKPKPVTKLAFSSVQLDIAKAAGIIVLTQELVKLSNPSAETLVRNDMIRGIAQFLDSQFIDPAVAAVAGVNPASITNGAPTQAATTNPLADLLALISHFSTNNIPVDGLTIIMSPSNALAWSFYTSGGGSDRLFPSLTMNGGNVQGINVVTSQAAGALVIAFQPNLILYADDGGVTIDASQEASLQMDSAPASPADATTVYVSLWQTNHVGLRAERFINWKRTMTNAVKYLTAAVYPAPAATAEPVA